MDELINYFKNIDIHIGDIIVNGNNEYFEILSFSSYNNNINNYIINCKCIFGNKNKLHRMHIAQEYNFKNFSLKKATKEQIDYVNKMIVFQ